MKHLGIGIALTLTLVFLLIAGCSSEEKKFDSDSAKLTGAVVGLGLDDDARATDASDVFHPDTPAIFVSVKVSDAPPATEVQADWTYVRGELEGVSDYVVDSTTTQAEKEGYVGLSLTRPDTGWPLGEYKVVLRIDGTEKLSVGFTVVKDTSAAGQTDDQTNLLESLFRSTAGTEPPPEGTADGSESGSTSAGSIFQGTGDTPKTPTPTAASPPPSDTPKDSVTGDVEPPLTPQELILVTWDCRLQMGAQQTMVVFAFQADNTVLADGIPLPYELLVGGIRIGLDEYTMSVDAQNLGLLHTSGFTVQCERSSGSATAGGGQTVELVAGQSYNGGTTIKISGLGLSFVVPDGWSGGMAQGAEVIFLSSDTRTGFVMVLAHPATNATDLITILGQPTALSQDVVLAPVGTPVVMGDWVRAIYSGGDVTAALSGFALGLISPEGRGIIYLGAGPEGTGEYFAGLIQEMATNTAAVPLISAGGISQDGTGSTGGDQSGLAQEWTAFLRGQRLTYMSTYSNEGVNDYVGSSVRRDMDLCGDGRFFYVDESSVSVDSSGTSGFDSSGDSQTGTWSVVTEGGQVGLELRWGNGETSAHLLEYADGVTYIDQKRWFVTDKNPNC